MPERRNQKICESCGNTRTVIRIRQILMLPAGVDVLPLIVALKAQLDQVGVKKKRPGVAANP